MVVTQVLDSLVTNVLEYCSREDTREQLETRVLAPIMRYLSDKFSWCVRLFQAVAVLVLVQTLLLLWLLARELRRPPVF